MNHVTKLKSFQHQRGFVRIYVSTQHTHTHNADTILSIDGQSHLSLILVLGLGLVARHVRAAPRRKTAVAMRGKAIVKAMADRRRQASGKAPSMTNLSFRYEMIDDFL